MSTGEDRLKTIIGHGKEYGFLFPSSEIYDGLSATYNYGPCGAELKNNIRQHWWAAFRSQTKRFSKRSSLWRVPRWWIIPAAKLRASGCPGSSPWHVARSSRPYGQHWNLTSRLPSTFPTPPRMDHRNTILTLAAALATGLTAQSPFEFADQRTHEVGYYTCARAGDVWVVGGGAGSVGGGFTGHFIQAVRSDGTPGWSFPFLAYSGTVIPMDMRSMPGGRALVIGPVDWCDVWAPTSVMLLVDSSGTVIWEKEYYVEWATNVDVTDDGRILLSAYDIGLIADANGDSLTSFMLDTLGLPAPRWSVWDSDSTVMLIRTGMTTLLERRSLDAEVLASNDQIDVADAIRWNGHRLAMEEDGSIHVLDEDLSILSSFVFGFDFERGRFLRSASTLWAIGNTVAVEFDALLNILQTVVLDPNDIFADNAFGDFAVTGDTLAMAGTVVTAQHPAGILRTVVADGTVATHDEDVSIMLLGIDTAWCSGSGGTGYPQANVTVEVTNEGGGLVDSVVLCHSAFGWMCSSVGAYLHLNDLSLAPGASIVATMDSLWLDDTPCGSMNLDHEVCISVTSPNAVYDRDGSDNLACDTAHIVLGIAEADRSAAPFTLINDAAGLVLWFHEASKTALQLKLLDARGRVLLSDIVPAGTDRHALNTSVIAGGVHLIEVGDARSGRWTVKWVKE